MARSSAKPAAETVHPDARAARELLLWLRKERIAADAIQVGALRIEGLKDLALRGTEASEGKPKQAATRRQSMYERYGGPLIAGAEAKPGSPAQPESAVTEQDDED